MSTSTSSIKSRLINHARLNRKLVDQVFLEYCLERFLYRLMATGNSEKYILKGGILFNLLYMKSQRITRDLDLCSLHPFDQEVLKTDFKKAMELNVGDGITWNFSSLRIEYREREANGPLSELSFTCLLGRSEVVVKIDISYSDAIYGTTEKHTVRSILNEFDSVELNCYSLETMVAEKLHAIYVLGERTTRFKDYFDLYFLLQDKYLKFGIMLESINTTFKNRGTKVPSSYSNTPIPDFIQSDLFEPQWKVFLKKINHEYIEPALLVKAFSKVLVGALDNFGDEGYLKTRELPKILSLIGLGAGIYEGFDWEKERREAWGEE
jgi:predicted nucleotidyltransferase component of viral defense system